MRRPEVTDEELRSPALDEGAEERAPSLIVAAAQADGLTQPPHPGHVVQFYEDDAFLVDRVADFLAVGLAGGEPVIVVATPEHRASFAALLDRRGLDTDAAAARGQLVWLDAAETLARFMVGDMPDWTLFSSVFGEVLAQSRRRRPLACVRAYGEMVDLLWRAGNKQGALRLEAMWNEFSSSHSLSLLCAYVMANFFRAGDADSLRDVCRAHAEVWPAPPAGPADAARRIAEPDAERRELSELQQHARSLEHEVEQRKELERALREALIREKAARQEAERSVRYNEMFAGMLGHDLRNPLSAITTGANYIARLNAHQKTTKAASRILSSAERMARMIDQLLDFTRIRVGGGLSLAPSRFDLEELLCKVKDELEAANPDRTVVVDVEGNATGEWDHDRLLQVFSNLIGNALHHGRSDHPVKVRCNGKRSKDLSVSVHNAGAVPPEVLPVLFEPFRGTARYQRTRGLGLGLFITQQIIAAHGGTIDVASEAATGTTFRLLLPRRPQPALAAVPAPSEKADLH
ncbi:MAG TPA: MEDS domain-containing protein [Polyangia bacterium]|nr:MEDS domain-containing protein [Polyangia bacterium]